MDKNYQLRLLSGAIEDYKNNLMTLGVLVRKLEGFMAIIQDKSFNERLFDAYLALEEVYARTKAGDFEFDQDGKPVVDRALYKIMNDIIPATLIPDRHQNASGDERNVVHDRQI